MPRPSRAKRKGRKEKKCQDHKQAKLSGPTGKARAEICQSPCEAAQILGCAKRDLELSLSPSWDWGPMQENQDAKVPHPMDVLYMEYFHVTRTPPPVGYCTYLTEDLCQTPPK